MGRRWRSPASERPPHARSRLPHSTPAVELLYPFYRLANGATASGHTGPLESRCLHPGCFLTRPGERWASVSAVQDTGPPSHMAWNPELNVPHRAPDQQLGLRGLTQDQRIPFPPWAAPRSGWPFISWRWKGRHSRKEGKARSRTPHFLSGGLGSSRLFLLPNLYSSAPNHRVCTPLSSHWVPNATTLG